MAIDILGSREKPKDGRGQNGDPNPSSVHGKQPKLGNPSVAPPAVVDGVLTGKREANNLRDSFNMNASSDQARLDSIQRGGETPHHAMRSRQHSGETVPSANVRRANRGQGH
jgi:hypothetical protein